MTRLYTLLFALGLTLGCNQSTQEVDSKADDLAAPLLHTEAPPPDPTGTPPPPPLGTSPMEEGKDETLARNGVVIPMGRVRNEWFKKLDEVNPQLHDTLLEALFLSRQSGKQVYVLKRRLGTDEKPGPVVYAPSLTRGGADNLLSVQFSDRSFHFDHFDTKEDGPTLEQVRERMFTEERIRRLKRDLGIFGNP